MCILTNKCRSAGTSNSTYGSSPAWWWSYQMRILRLLINPSSPSAGPPPLAESEQVAPEDPKDLGQASEYIHVHPRMLVNNNQPVAPPPPGIRQNQAIQSEDEHSATVGHSQRQGPQPQNRKENCCRKAAEHTVPKAKKYKSMDSD